MFIGTPEELKIAKAEIVQVYHGINHHHSYLSIDCGVKIASKLFTDSNIARKQQCGRTKAEIIVENILAPRSFEMVHAELRASSDSPISFSIATDASNKGNRKLYPIAVRYFDVNQGVRDRILDFYQDSKEDSKAIYDQIKRCLEINDLDMKNVSSFSADNAPVNYGEKNSVFQKLRDVHPDIIKSNCNAHVVHNTGRHACKALTYDVECLVLKIYAEFSSSAKNVQNLKECFEDFDLEFQDVMRHVVTRWLSLLPAIERLIAKWPAIKQYFLDQGEEEVDKIVWKFVGDQEDEINDDLNAPLTMPECYLYFVHHFMNILTKTIKCLEADYVMSSDIHEIMVQLKNQIETRYQDGFYGSKVNKSLDYLGREKRYKFEEEAKKVYKRALEYLCSWYDYENTPFQYFSVINLKGKSPTYQSLVEAAKAVKLEIDEDALYEEVILLASAFSAKEESQIRLDLQWVKIFQSSNGFKELPKIVGKILSIPISNAYVEKIFSIMGNVWTNLRNRLRVDMVKAELATKLNFDMSCDEFEKFISLPEQSQLLRKVISQEKYSWRRPNEVKNTIFSIKYSINFHKNSNNNTFFFF